LPTFILPPDPAVITGQREPGERAIPRKHGSMDKNAAPNANANSNSFELNERSNDRTPNECQIHDEMIARQVFSKKHSSLDPPKHEKRHHPSRCRLLSTLLDLSRLVSLLTSVCQHKLVTRMRTTEPDCHEPECFIYLIRFRFLCVHQRPVFIQHIYEHLSSFLCPYLGTQICTPY
jgi:hypothetical protein